MTITSTLKEAVGMEETPSSKLPAPVNAPLSSSLHTLNPLTFPFNRPFLLHDTSIEGFLLIVPLHVPAPPASREAMSAARLPLQYRDSCAHLLIPLNQCRFREFYLPWRCEDERHSYEKCQYVEFKKRVAKMDEIRAAKGGERSN